MYITWPSNIFGTPLQHFIFNFCYLFIQENKASELWLFAYFGFPLRWLAGQAAVVLVLDIREDVILLLNKLLPHCLACSW